MNVTRRELWENLLCLLPELQCINYKIITSRYKQHRANQYHPWINQTRFSIFDHFLNAFKSFLLSENIVEKNFSTSLSSWTMLM